MGENESGQIAPGVPASKACPLKFRSSLQGKMKPTPLYLFHTLSVPLCCHPCCSRYCEQGLGVLLHRMLEASLQPFQLCGDDRSLERPKARAVGTDRRVYLQSCISGHNGTASSGALVKKIKETYKGKSSLQKGQVACHPWKAKPPLTLSRLLGSQKKCPRLQDFDNVSNEIAFA